MYTLSGIMVAAALSHYLVKPLSEKQLLTLSDYHIEQRKNIIDVPDTSKKEV